MRKLFTFLLALAACVCASHAAPAVAVNGKLPGTFSVSATKKVYFSQGNLRFTRTSTSAAWSTGKFSFMDNQYDYIETSNVSDDYANETAIGFFGWATSNINSPANTNYLPTNTNTTNASYGSGITTGNVNWATAHANYDWGANTGDLGTGWRTLTQAEWQYLFNTRTVNGGKGNGKSYTSGQSVNGTLGIVLYPDDYTGAVYTTDSDWSTFEDAGCVFLPLAGYRDGTSVSDVGSSGFYWSSTSSTSTRACLVQFLGSVVYPTGASNRYRGYSVRLVSDIAPLVPAVITSVPTAKIGLVYTGAAQTLINAGEATGGEMQYSLDNTNWSTNLPSGINAVEYTVYYRVVGDANHIDIDAASLNVTIAKAALSVTAEAKEVTYGEAAPAYTASYSGFVNNEDESVLGGALTFDCAYTAGNAAGAYDITPSGLTSSNYAIAFVGGTLTVNKAASVITIVPTAKIGLVYTGAALTLIQAGEATGGEMQYSLDNTNWSTDLPTGINAAEYTVYYKFVGDANHNNSAVSNFQVTIAKSSTVTIGTIPAAIENLEYTGSAQPLISAGASNDGTMQYSLDGTNWSTSIPTGTLVGEYTVYYKVVGDANHNDYTPSPNTIVVAIAASNRDINAYLDPKNEGVYYSTFFDSRVKYELPQGVNAYVADLDESDLLLAKVANEGEVIPADQAVILVANAENFTLTPSDEEAVTFTANNDLLGVDEVTAAQANCYVLSGTNEYGVGFYQINSTSLKAHKAYVIYSGSAAPKRMRFVFNQEQVATGIDNANADIKVEKRIENGQLIIIKNGVRYNVQGQIVK